MKFSKTYIFPRVLQPPSAAGLNSLRKLIKSGRILHRIGHFFLVKKILPSIIFLSSTRDLNFCSWIQAKLLVPVKSSTDFIGTLYWSK